jgi:arginyl-tRNA--protein-N-Asp/Glu arginylyltransferase
MDDESNAIVEQTIGGKDVSAKTSSEKMSVIRPYGYSVSKCGYCKGSRSNIIKGQESATPQPKLSSLALLSHSTNTSASKSSLASKSYSVLADNVSPNLYEGFIHRGWRRSGLHLYKPQNFSSCCPTLTIRLLTREFKPSKSQRKVLRKMENILRSPQRPRQRKEELVTVGTTTTTTTPTSMPTSTSKKQKRNHREKHKVNNRKSRITSSQPETCSHPDVDMAKTSSLCSSPIEEQVLATGVLQRLEQATINALEKCLSPSSIRNNWKEFAEQQKHECKWKTSYRILPPSKRERKQSQVRAVSSICAQISGHLNSTFSADRIPRELLVQQVVQTIRNAEESLIAPNNNGNEITIPSNDRKVSITCIEAHQPSGQISCTIQVKEEIAKIDSNVSVHNNENENDTEMNESTSKEHNKMNHKSNSDINFGKLAHWYEKTTGEQLDLEPNKHCITIETLPAHQSALYPDVHRLYAHYQHVVHNDPNPFSNDPKTDILNRNNDNDDEDEEPKLETDDPSELDWGDAPTYFTSKISTMLNAYIQSFDSKECRHAVLSNYYSFYQFLVEAPFPHPNVCNKQIKTPDDNGRSTQQIPELSWNENNDYPSSPLPCGLYHQHYRLGGEFLIAVGVIDILPTGLSSVYLFYHPTFSYELVALGKYAILKEIEFARDVLKVPYYYLGY